jgi:hypothetical protein
MKNDPQLLQKTQNFFNLKFSSKGSAGFPGEALEPLAIFDMQGSSKK